MKIRFFKINYLLIFFMLVIFSCVSINKNGYELLSQEQKSKIKIFDDLGRQVYSQAFNDTIYNTINVSGFSKGLYFLKVYYTNEQVLVFKFNKT